MADGDATLQAKLDELMKSMPATAQGVLEVIAKEGVLGTRGDPMMCPLAKWLKKMLGDTAKSVCTSNLGVSVFTFGGIGSTVASHELTPVCAAFMNRFDAGDYPELVLPPYPEKR